MEIPAEALEALYARVGRMTMEADAGRARIAALQREVERLKQFEAEVASLRETVQDLEEVNRVLKESLSPSCVHPGASVIDATRFPAWEHPTYVGGHFACDPVAPVSEATASVNRDAYRREVGPQPVTAPVSIHDAIADAVSAEPVTETDHYPE